MADKPLDKQELANRIEKLRPYLLQGQSLKQACQNAEIPITSTYDYYNSDPEFANQIDNIKLNVNRIYFQSNYSRILIIGNKLGKLAKIYNDYVEKKIDEKQYLADIEKWKLSPEEERYWNWLAEHHPTLKDDFSARSEVTGKDGADLIPKELSEPKAIETALKAIEFLIKK